MFLFPRRRRLIYILAAGVFLFGCILLMKTLSSTESEDEERLRRLKITKDDTDWMRWLDPKALMDDLRNKTKNFNFSLQIRNLSTYDLRILKDDKAIIGPASLIENIRDRISDVKTNDEQSVHFGKEIGPPPNYNVHAFYYGWYGNPKIDGKYLHWNHKYLPHWRPEIAKKFRKGAHNPPEDIGSNFYPELGPYSSHDTKIIHNHMQQLCYAGIGVLAVSWYPSGKADDQGGPPDPLIPTLLNIALLYDLKVTLHIEPYEGRNDKTLEEDVKYIIDTYSKHKAFYKYQRKDGRLLPFLYIYDSYHTDAKDWANLLTQKGSHSIRNTKYDCVFIALVVQASQKDAITIGGFDGLYTYFATSGFSYGSTWRSWPQLSSFAKQTQSLFIPSVGPGYIDTGIRPWNSENTRLRANGEYYMKSWKSALNVNPEIVSITSFNEWHEGTQIEKAVPKSVPGLVYKDYQPNGPDYYLKLTRESIQKFKEMKKTLQNHHKISNKK